MVNKHMTTAVDIYRYFQTFKDAYAAFMKPLCETLGMPQSALDMLLFLANNPDNNTSSEVCAYLHMKPGIVSFHADKLSEEGFIERETSLSDRRKLHLSPTKKALPIIERGRIMQEEFRLKMMNGLDEERVTEFVNSIESIEKNLENIIEELK